MGFDTKYRPHRLGDVVGQQGVISVIRRIIQTGTGFQQSYIFAGSHGSGKTTLGRILAESLLCDSPTSEGEHCGECHSCTSFESGKNPDFIEVDAATNSGKADMKKIVEQIQYTSFSGKRRIYLFDESHQLSKDALDAILKPMEDNIHGSEEKKLVCIFCTTEPEKMRQTILSRCAPVFSIRKPDVESISDRLAFVCESEGIRFEKEALRLIVEVSESHIRDSLKSLEGVAKLGDVTQEAVKSHLRLDANSSYVEILSYLGRDINQCVSLLDTAVETAPPSVIYARLSEIAMLAYRLGLGISTVPSYMNPDKIREVYDQHGDSLVVISDRLSSRPGKPTASMLSCDLAYLHHLLRGGLQVRDLSIQVSDNGQTSGSESNSSGKLGGGYEISDHVWVPSEMKASSSVKPSVKAEGVEIDPVRVFFQNVRDVANRRRDADQ